MGTSVGPVATICANRSSLKPRKFGFYYSRVSNDRTTKPKAPRLVWMGTLTSPSTRPSSSTRLQSLWRTLPSWRQLQCPTPPPALHSRDRKRPRLESLKHQQLRELLLSLHRRRRQR